MNAEQMAEEMYPESATTYGYQAVREAFENGWRAALTTPQADCTCPSGDGSLRWPCPAHPPAPQEGEARSPEFEVLEQELFKHQPVLSMEDGSIRGCQCLDRVFHRGTEDWGTHLAEVFESLSRTTSPDAATERWRGDYFIQKRAADKAEAERDAALAAVERVRARHTQGTVQIVSHDGTSVPRETCLQCSQTQVGEYCNPVDTFIWPCPTVAALDGAPEPEWEWMSRAYFAELDRTWDSPIADEETARAMNRSTNDSEPGLTAKLMRRRKAGPWLPVGGETDGE